MRVVGRKRAAFRIYEGEAHVVMLEERMRTEDTPINTITSQRTADTQRLYRIEIKQPSQIPHAISNLV